MTKEGVYVHGKKVRDLTNTDKLFVDYMVLEQENKQLKKQNELEFNDFVKFRKEQEDKHLEKTDKLIKENYHLKKQLKQKDEIINEAKEWIKEYIKEWANADEVEKDMKELLDILKKTKGENE